MEYQTYSIVDESGDAELRLYQIFPGVVLVYSSVQMEEYRLDDYPEELMGHLIEIHHCLEGRVEQIYDDEVFYLEPGDFALGIRKEQNRHYYFPTTYYRGCTILIDTIRAPKCFSEFLEDVRVQPMEVARRLCQERNSFYIRNQSYINHIFSELCTVQENLGKGYMKVKILELLLILSTISPGVNEVPRQSLPKTQIQLAKQGAEYLTQNMERRITIPELARQFNVSETTMKNAFKAVYGVPVYSFIRMQKIHRAAQLLRNSDAAVSDIAYDLGYKNTSKFSDAFREITGETPSEFRANYKKTQSKRTIKLEEGVSID